MPKQDVLSQAKKLPLQPGVYQFWGAKKEILYIGRATSLRRRVLQYFQKRLDPRIAEMVALARELKFYPTDTVLEAIILEAKLIKKHWPKYNVKDKDNRSFVYVVFNLAEEFPKPLIVRERELNKFPKNSAKVFGPFQNASLLKNTLRIIRRIFPYSTCKPPVAGKSGKPCFDYQVGLCPGTCVGQINSKEYQKNIKNIVALFEGKKKQLVKALGKSDERAAFGLKHINDASLISRAELSGMEEVPVSRIEAYDISHFSGKETVGAMSVFIDGLPDKTQYRLFNIKTVGNNDLLALEEMITRRLNHPEWPSPDIFLIDGGRPQISHLNKIFTAKQIAKPLIGISKLAGDELVFPKATKKNIRDLASSVKPILVMARDEAHRFSNSARRRKMKIR